MTDPTPRNVTAAEDLMLRNAVKRASKLVAEGQFSPCACIGPAGDCPCIRRSRGQKVEITETTIAPALFALLPDEDKKTINDLKVKALGLYMQQMRNARPVAQPANTDSVPGIPPGSGARPDQPKLPESVGIGGSSIGLGAEGEQ